MSMHPVVAAIDRLSTGAARELLVESKPLQKESRCNPMKSKP
jgi:hypothetical protein